MNLSAPLAIRAWLVGLGSVGQDEITKESRSLRTVRLVRVFRFPVLLRTPAVTRRRPRFSYFRVVQLFHESMASALKSLLFIGIYTILHWNASFNTEA